jgi:hypothetical protein
MNSDAPSRMNIPSQLLYELRERSSRGRRFSIWDGERSEKDSARFAQLRFLRKPQLRSLVRLKHGYEDIHSCPFHLAYLVLQPVSPTRAWNYGETSLSAGLNPERIHAPMLAVPNVSKP